MWKKKIGAGFETLQNTRHIWFKPAECWNACKGKSRGEFGSPCSCGFIFFLFRSSSSFLGFLRTILQVLDWVIRRSLVPLPIDDDYEDSSDDSENADIELHDDDNNDNAAEDEDVADLEENEQEDIPMDGDLEVE